VGVGAILKAQDLFASLTPEEIDRVSRFSAVKKLAAGEAVYRHDTPATHLFVLLKGRVVLRLPAHGSELGLVLRRAEPGHFLGLAALAGSERYTVTAVCTAASEVLAIDIRPFKELLYANPRVGYEIMRAVAQGYCERSVEVAHRLQAIVDQIEFVP
jgi:thioredoxin reductase (NADPH)